MRISGYVEMLTFGPAKVFFPSRRVPVSNLLNYASDYILVVDSDMKITLVNDTFLGFLGSTRENTLGQTMEDIIQQIFEDNKEILDGINQALDGKSFIHKIKAEIDGENNFFKIRIMPTTFEDGTNGVSLIIKNDTDHKIAEMALRESQESFKSLLDKLNKNKK
jgi:PAS domain S-box-containing protein